MLWEPLQGYSSIEVAPSAASLPSPPCLAEHLSFPEGCHQLHLVNHLEPLLSPGSAPIPGWLTVLWEHCCGFR